MTEAPGAVDPADVVLQALRERGAPQQDPLRWAGLEALARRRQPVQGLARQVLDARLAERLGRWQAELAAATDAAAAPGVAASSAAPSAAPRPATAELAAWVRSLSAGLGGSAPGELRVLRQYRPQWTDLRTEQRLLAAPAQVPAQAGPLHSAGLAQRTIDLLRSLSPAYLQALVTQVDALLWLEAAAGDDALLPPGSGRSPPERRPSAATRARGKGGRRT